MEVVYKHPEIRKLWELAGEIGTKASQSDDVSLTELYSYISDVLDRCEEMELITYKEG